MPFALTGKEKLILSTLALLIALGVLGLVLL